MVWPSKHALPKSITLISGKSLLGGWFVVVGFVVAVAVAEEEEEFVVVEVALLWWLGSEEATFNKMFSGFKSQWIICNECNCRVASINCVKMARK